MRSGKVHSRQQGATLVEFALVAAGGFFLLLIGVLELGRVLFTYSAANEATRLGARIAVVCDAKADVITDRMSELVPELTASTVSVTYDPSDCAPDAETARSQCRSATVAIKPGTTIQTVIPFVNFAVDIPSFSTTFTREAMDSSTCT